MKKKKIFVDSEKEISLCVETGERIKDHNEKKNKTDSIIKPNMGFNLTKSQLAIRINNQFRDKLVLDKYNYSEEGKYLYIKCDKK